MFSNKYALVNISFTYFIVGTVFIIKEAVLTNKTLARTQVIVLIDYLLITSTKQLFFIYILLFII
jgi:hypothetical protein